MMKGKKIFQAYTEWGDVFDQLTDEQAGGLIKHIFDYVRDKDPESTDPIVNLTFTPIKAQLQRDLVKWKARADSSRSNGLKGGRPKKPEVIKGNPDNLAGLVGSGEKPTKPVEVEVEVEVIPVEVEAEVIIVEDIQKQKNKLFKPDFEKFLLKAFSYLGKKYYRGNPSTHKIESEIRKWLIPQNPTEQINNLLAYLKVTDTKFRVKTISSLLVKLEEYNYTQDLKTKLSPSIKPKKSPEQLNKIMQEEQELREVYRKQREANEIKEQSFSVCPECQEIECDCTETEKENAAKSRIKQIKKNFKIVK